VSEFIDRACTRALDDHLDTRKHSLKAWRRIGDQVFDAMCREGRIKRRD
jgi:hypothetical protein